MLTLKSWTYSFLTLPFGVSIYSLGLHWVYRDVIQPRFAYSGHDYAEPDVLVSIIAWMITSLTANFLPRRLGPPSALILWILFVVTIAPTTLMGPYLNIVSSWDAIVLGAGFSIAFIGICFLMTRSEPVRALIPSLSPTSFCVVIGIFSVFVYVFMGFTAGFNFQFLSVRDVYAVRDDFAEAASGTGLLSYLIITQANVINPLVMSMGLIKRRWWLFGIGVMGQLVLYSSTGFKTFLFSIPAVLIVALAFWRNSRPRGVLLLLGASGVIIVSVVLDLLADDFIWSSLFSRRFLITPARLSNQYFNFYSEGPFEMLSHSILRPWVEQSYPYGPARMISVLTTGRPDTSMNANFFADSFAQFGWFGVAGVAFLLTIYLKILDRAAFGLPKAMASLAAVMPAVALSNTSALTAMLSHGLVALVAVLALSPRGTLDSEVPRASRTRPLRVISAKNQGGFAEVSGKRRIASLNILH